MPAALGALLAAILMTALPACRRAPDPSTRLIVPESTSPTLTGTAADPNRVGAGTTEVKPLTAYAHRNQQSGKNNLVQVVFINMTDRDIVIGPKMFAVQAGGETIPGDDAKRALAMKFPRKAVKPGEGVAGIMAFPTVNDLQNQKLLFNSGDQDELTPGFQGVRYAAVIQPYRAVQSPPRPPLPTGSSKREMRQAEGELRQLQEALKKEIQKTK